MARSRLTALLLMGAMASGAACRRAAAPSEAGKGTASGPARRVVSLAPSLTEIVFAVGAGDRLVGVDDYVEFPEAAKALPRVGGFLNPNLERILGLRPDLVLMVHTFRTADDKLAAAGIRTAVIGNESLEDLDGAIGRVGELLGVDESAGALRTRLRRELEAVAAATAGLRRPSVAFVLDHRPGALGDLYVAGQRSFLVRLVEIAGGRNAFADVASGAARVGPEEVLRHAPEVILDATAGDVAGAWRALPTLPAVRSGRVLAVTEDKLTVPGPRVAAAARRLARLLHPEARPAADGGGDGA